MVLCLKNYYFSTIITSSINDYIYQFIWQLDCWGYRTISGANLWLLWMNLNFGWRWNEVGKICLEDMRKTSKRILTPTKVLTGRDLSDKMTLDLCNNLLVNQRWKIHELSTSIYSINGAKNMKMLLTHRLTNDTIIWVNPLHSWSDKWWLMSGKDFSAFRCSHVAVTLPILIVLLAFHTSLVV